MIDCRWGTEGAGGEGAETEGGGVAIGNPRADVSSLTFKSSLADQ